jgi:enoyl-CoA hydratase/carnithine racemase
MPELGPVIFEERNAGNGKAIGLITLSVEKTLNSLTLPMVELMREQLLEWQGNERIAAVFMHGAGEKAFCAGGDVHELHRSATKTPGGPCIEAETFFAQEYRLDYLLHTYSKPVVCWGHGIVMGGGLGLFAAASHAIVTEKTRIAMPEITIALYPDVGGTWFLNRMPGKCGLFVALTAAAMNAADTLYAGLARYFVRSERKAELLKALVSMPWQGSNQQNRQLLTDMLRAFSPAKAVTVDEQAIPSSLAIHRGEIDALCAGDDLGQVVANILAHESDDKWLQKAQSSLRHGSALAANTIWQQLHRGSGMSLEEVFQFEIMVSTNVVRHPEFAEGVRALLIDKDKSPRWLYEGVKAVPADLIQQLMTPPWEHNPLADLVSA